MKPAPVIAIDGPAGAGKGSLAFGLSRALGGWSVLDSGVLYRCLGWAAIRSGTAFDNAEGLARLVEGFDSLEFRPDASDRRVHTWLGEADISDQLRVEEVSRAASQVARHRPVRSVLLRFQHSLRRPPGLIADGRDMGTRVFPDALLKVFLTADARERAKRRYIQLHGDFDLNNREAPAIIANLQKGIAERDRLDRQRQTDPLSPAPDALQLDSTGLSEQDVLSKVLNWAAECGLNVKGSRGRVESAHE
ncbi:MAG: (d)CMP kinase [Gammaproteobacteria bacterium AqS3]|nr:(d)CMP kinase [Gammaproteobacteria bacterium AqS3]